MAWRGMAWNGVAWRTLNDKAGLTARIHRSVGLAARRPPREQQSRSLCGRGCLCRSSHTGDFNIGTQVATMPGAWRYSVSAGTVWPGVSTLRLSEIGHLICNFSLSVATRTVV